MDAIRAARSSSGIDSAQRGADLSELAGAPARHITPPHRENCPATSRYAQLREPVRSPTPAKHEEAGIGNEAVHAIATL